MKPRILIVDDEPDACELLQVALEGRGYGVTVRNDVGSAAAAATEVEFDVVITDLQLGDESGLTLCTRMAAEHPNVPVILITGHGTMEAAIAAIRAGAFDFVPKPIDLEALRHRIDRALRQRELEVEVKRLQRVVSDAPAAPGMLGNSPPMRKVFSLIDRVAQGDASVLVTGETGVGKELVARAIHDHGRRAEGPFIVVNCAAMPASLLESELFGHVRGAFTDAKHARIGLFAQANGGTLFLDELGELPMEMQPKLLRALQEKSIRPVGGDAELPFDARVITATNRDLEEEVERGRFREDLYYRVHVVRLHVPPLRARGTDILVLAQYFLQRIAARECKPITGLSVAVAEKLLSYDWPGNVRELENCIERAVALAQFEELRVQDLPDKVRRYEAGEVVVVGADPAELPTLEELEARYIRRVLKVAGGNKTQAAEILGLARRTLYRRLEKIVQPEHDPTEKPGGSPR